MYEAKNLGRQHQKRYTQN